jgi:glutaredoxin
MRLEIFSRVDCPHCVRLKRHLVEEHPDVGFDETVLDPQRAEEYGRMRDALLARVAPSAHRTFPFVFDVETGAFLGGCDDVCGLLDATRMDLEEEEEVWAAEGPLGPGREAAPKAKAAAGHAGAAT